MRLAGSVARIVMAEWGSRFTTILKENDIKVEMAVAYVDDIRVLTSLLKDGMRWATKEKKFLWRADWQEEDKAEDISDEQRTARELRKSMNSIFSNIQFTAEIPEDFPNGRLPTLDCEIWLEGGPEVRNGDEWQEGKVVSKRNICIVSMKKR